MSALTLTGLVSAGLALTLWLGSLRARRVDFVDVAWPLLHLVPGLIYVTAAVSNGVVTARQLLLATLLSMWAIRLAAYLAIRTAGAPEDARYAAIRRANEPGFRWKALYLIFGFQAALAWLISAMLMPVAFDPTPLGWLDAVAALVVVVGIGYEAVADVQLAAFRRRDDGGVLDSGLWAYSRHPNYFGEWCVWAGFTGLALNAGAWWAVAGLAVVTLLLLRVSGVRLMERTIGKRRPGYAEYVERTNAFWPGRPRQLSVVLVCALGGLLGTGAEAAPSERFVFEASVGTRIIGTHDFEIVSRGRHVDVTSRADFEVKVLFYRAFSYTHRAEERYVGACLDAIASATDTNGHQSTVSGARVDDGFVVATDDTERRYPGCIMSFAYWDRALLSQRQLLNPQTGALTDVTVEPLGTRRVDSPTGPAVADAYRLTAPKLDITVYYRASDGLWVGLDSTTPEGRELTYRLIDYDRAPAPSARDAALRNGLPTLARRQISAPSVRGTGQPHDVAAAGELRAHELSLDGDVRVVPLL
jgi:steroid 5-alpha reductase family enzyme